ncbi:hypothetical protein FGO68_gene6000 [Halteria grandinella]|uniref:Uncharacterized protein n=1 Tax=Halteria grandinella TaxID=5974 RepID=A0A8J8P361_HALGN|nr:hypothetical protein FGO68_gene6000 [Halteria grandinella]
MARLYFLSQRNLALRSFSTIPPNPQDTPTPLKQLDINTINGSNRVQDPFFKDDELVQRIKLEGTQPTNWRLITGNSRIPRNVERFIMFCFISFWIGLFYDNMYIDQALRTKGI